MHSAYNTHIVRVPYQCQTSYVSRAYNIQYACMHMYRLENIQIISPSIQLSKGRPTQYLSYNSTRHLSLHVVTHSAHHLSLPTMMSSLQTQYVASKPQHIFKAHYVASKDAGTLANASVSGAAGSLSLMTPPKKLLWIKYWWIVGQPLTLFLTLC